MTPAANQPEKDAAKIAADAAAAKRIQAAIDAMVDAMVRGTTNEWTGGYGPAGYDAVRELAQVLGRELSGAAMEGSKATLAAMDRAMKDAGASVAETIGHAGPLARVAPSKAIEAMVRREPRLAASADEVARLYSTSKDVFALAKSIELAVSQRVHGATIEALRSGATSVTARDVIASMGDWTAGYAETVFRTNAMTAYADGQDITAKMPGVREVMVGYEVVGPVDGDTRPNHAAYVGFRAPLDATVWQQGPPFGFNCRHSKVLIDRFRAERNGWLDANGDLLPMALPRGAHPDDGFRPQG